MFIVLDRASGELTYVNAGHNSPVIFSPGSARVLEATGIPLGLLSEAKYESRIAKIRPGDALLVYTDGLTDSMAAQDPERRLAEVLATSRQTMRALQALVDPKLHEDDATILLVKRTASLLAES